MEMNTKGRPSGFKVKKQAASQARFEPSTPSRTVEVVGVSGLDRTTTRRSEMNPRERPRGRGQGLGRQAQSG